MSNKKKNDSALANNRKARFNFHILDTFEAGLVLQGSEVKSMKAGHVQLAEGYIRIKKGEAFLENVHVRTYDHAGSFIPEQDRSRKLLLHKNEILRLEKELMLQKSTLVPLKLYVKKGKIKLLVGLAKGKQAQDKRKTIKDREAKRDLDRLNKTRFG